MNLKKIVIAIIIIIIIIFILGILLLINSEKGDINSKHSRTESKEIENKKTTIKLENSVGSTPYSGNSKLKDIVLESQFFNIKSILDKYFYERNKLQLKDSDIILPRMGIKESEIKTYIEKQKQEQLNLAKKVFFNMLAPEYIEEFNISEDNLSDKYGIDFSYEYIIDKIKIAEINHRISLYVVTGKTLNILNSTKKDFKIIIAVDATNRTYSIYPDEYLIYHKISLENGSKLNISTDKIESRTHNVYEIQEFSDEKICKEYFESLKKEILYTPTEVYNKLENEYSKKRFQNKSEFNNYIDKIKKCMDVNTLNLYKILKTNDIVQLICIDNFNNTYTFIRKNSIFNYSVQLDDYTLLSSADTAAYSNLSEYGKIKYNTNKFIKMINTGDYRSIYSLLNEDFKNSSFNNLDNLENYIKSNFYDINKIELIDNKEYDRYYVSKYKLINQLDNNESKNINIIISKTNDTNFNMSFSFE